MGASNTLPSRDQATHQFVRDRSARSLGPSLAVPAGESPGSPDEWFADLNPDFGVLPDDRDPAQHRFAADREEALALGTRTIEALRTHNHDDPDQRTRAITGAYVEAELDVASPVPSADPRASPQRAGALSMAGGKRERGQEQQVLQPIDRRLLPATPLVQVVRNLAQRRQQPLDVLMRPWLLQALKRGERTGHLTVLTGERVCDEVLGWHPRMVWGDTYDATVRDLTLHKGRHQPVRPPPTAAVAAASTAVRLTPSSAEPPGGQPVREVSARPDWPDPPTATTDPRRPLQLPSMPRRSALMASDNFTVQIGNLTNDPELRFTNNGTPVTNFGLAVNTRVKDGDTWRAGDTHFFRVNVWRDQAENVAESLRKGNRAVVIGQLKTRSWEPQEGDKRTVTEIDAAEVAPSLKWAIATPEKAIRDRNTSRAAERGQFDEPPPF
jgi:single-strand DNA-binding protein